METILAFIGFIGYILESPLTYIASITVFFVGGLIKALVQALDDAEADDIFWTIAGSFCIGALFPWAIAGLLYCSVILSIFWIPTLLFVIIRNTRRSA